MTDEELKALITSNTAELKGMILALDKKIDVGFEAVKGELKRIDGEFKRIDGEFKRIDGEFKRMDEKIENQSARFEEKLESLEKRFEEKFDALDRRIEDQTAKLEEKIGGVETEISALDKRLGFSEFINRSTYIAVVGGLIVGFVKLIFFNNNP
ncbi:MAG: hypothetical protein AB4426_14415 [Xenococcaceae cyanobacterium]